LPFGALADDTQATSWWRGNWDGAKRIGGDGGTDVILSGWALHPYWGYSPELQAKENDAAYGGGFGRTLTDARGQRRTFYFTVIRDSHWNPQYSVGYMWLARTSMRGPRLGVGYSAFLIGREEYNYLPVPLALPTMSLGWDPAEVIMMYVPGYEVFYFAGRITFPQRAPKD
jgi:palmitoyl transferase